MTTSSRSSYQGSSQDTSQDSSADYGKIELFHMPDNYGKIELFHIPDTDTYSYYHILYHKNFPEEWAKSHATEYAGPSICYNCVDYGCINNVFIGYCANCAQFVYNGTRGRGFISAGIEDNEPDALKYPSIFETYMKDVDTSKIKLPMELHHISYDDDDNANTETTVYDINDYINADPYTDDNNTDTILSVLNCHYEGGYNDL